MATKPINNSSLTNPLLQPKAKDKAIIDPTGVTGAGAVAPQGQAGAQTVAKQGAASNFDVKISDGAKDKAAAHEKALAIARSTPDVREDRVASLKKQIDEGSYQIDSGKIADGMMREAIIEHLAEGDGKER